MQLLLFLASSRLSFYIFYVVSDKRKPSRDVVCYDTWSLRFALTLVAKRIHIVRHRPITSGTFIGDFVTAKVGWREFEFSSLKFWKKSDLSDPRTDRSNLKFQISSFFHFRRCVT